MPVVEPIVATPVLPLLHVPPGVALLSVVVCPTHMLIVPVMLAGSGNTVNVLVVKQVLGSVYVIVAVPGAGVADMPVTMPVPKPMSAIAGVLLAHVPPDMGWVSVVVSPWHTLSVPTIAAGAGVTVTTLVAVQPALKA